MSKIRVVHVGTGPTGMEGLRSILRDPRLQLVGQFAHTPEKVGMDSGVLAGVGPVGVTTTHDWGALLALRPDCLSYMGNGAGREDGVVADIVPFLEAGVDVVSTSLIPFCYPPLVPPALRDPVAAACEKGRSSFYNSGIDPGFATTQLPVALMAIAGDVRSVRMQELSIYGEYPVVPIMREIFGFGKPMGWVGPLFSGVVPHWWSGTVQAVATQLGVKVDELRPVYDTCAHHRDIDTTFGDVPAGTIAGIRFELQGLVRGQPVVTLEHVSLAHEDVAPHWTHPGPGLHHQYRVLVEGTPSFSCDLNVPHLDAGLAFTANHPINAISAVRAAKPGIIGPFDLPPYTTGSVPR